MATYSPSSLSIQPPSGGFKEGGWYSGRQYWAGTLSEPGVIHPSSNQVGAGQIVSPEVNAQSAALQGVSPQQLEAYLQSQRTAGAKVQPAAQPSAPAAPAAQAGSVPGAAGMGAALAPAQATLNLPELYKTYYESSGITAIEKELAERETQYLQAKGKISDNPFLDASMVDKRLRRLQQKYEEETVGLRNEIATKKADIETQLNLQTKQFDINSQAAKDALNRFNTLLSMGALDSASGEDIANITRATGISSSMIQSAIGTRAEEKKQKINSQVIKSEADDGTVTMTLVNTDTGEIIKQTNLGRIGNVQTGVREKAPTSGDQQIAVGQIISAYVQDEGYQARISPEDLYRQLLLQFPLAADYISKNWTVKKIRSATN